MSSVRSKLCAALTLVCALSLIAAASASAVSLRVSGNALVDASGNPLRIAGVNRSGSEYACAQGWGMFDGPTDDTSISAITTWGVNAVRVPLNEDCWLGINGVNPAYAGSNYRTAIHDYVNRLLSHGLAVILDLHWGAAGSQLALGQEQAPDADHATAFWSSVAGEYKGVDGIAFDLFNEPHDISWSCWLNGCTTSGGWAATGMQQLIDAVRGAGATQPVIAEGLGWGGDLSGWLANRPSDSAGQLAAGWHIYNFSGCNTTDCWNSTVAPVAQQVPVLATEVGENDCAGGFLNTLLPWADAHNIGYLAWAWNTASCTNGPSLISGYDGTPTGYGRAYRQYLAGRPQPLDPNARLDFEDGSADGFAVSWGSTLSVAPESGNAFSGSHGLTLNVSGNGYPAAATGTGLGGLGAGSTVTYHVWAPSGVGVSVSPMFFDAQWNVQVLAATNLQPGWNTISFTIPPSVSGLNRLGLQVNDSSGWTGGLVLDDLSWSADRFDFETGTSQGWGVSWGSTLTVGNESGTAFTGTHGLALDISGTGWPAAGVTGGLAGIGAGTVVSYRVWAPAGASVSVSPVVFDGSWRTTVLAAQALTAGWNLVRFTVPVGTSGVNEIGLQVNDSNGWSGRLVLDTVGW
ncbi:MAG TPA: cellulase family glycosylhydrolase [Solirubrobacteraceae bacterium]